jgi:poly(hydroxyalkanoate) depolymerase family esterase
LNPLARLLARLSKPKPEATVRRQPHAIDAERIAETIDRALASAGVDPQAGPAKSIRATIEHALKQAGLRQTGPITVARPAMNPATDVIGTRRGPVVAASATPAPAAGGEFLSRSFNNQAGTRAYKLYIPVGHAGAASGPVPLIVMLHGCTQTPDDFAAGTRMNALADAHGFLVAYPAQAARDNGSKCWNWFRAGDQLRERGEPSLIAGITRAVASDYRIDERRIFVAGLSAGAAMAVILGETYPDIFAAVGAHSGLPFGAAHDVPSALAAMNGGAGMSGARHPLRERKASAIPTIVFHGTADRTVDQRNGLAIVHDATNAEGNARLHASSHEGKVDGGRRYTHEVFSDPTAQPLVELWIVHGAGHAWSGGSALGTYTDPSGPDASAEMVRFFLQRRSGRG